MTDPNTPAHGGGHPASPSQVADHDDNLDHLEQTHSDGEQEPEFSAVAPEDEAPAASDEGSAEGVPSEEASAEAPRDETVRDETAPDETAPAESEPAAAGDTPVEPAWSARRSDAETGSDPASASEPERPLPPLSPPSSAAAPAATATGSLHDDSALRAAEAARAGVPADDQAQDPAVSSGASASASDTSDLDDTRISAPNGARSNTAAWTPPPAPASPSEYPAPATAATPTPYAPPPTGATEAIVAPDRPVTSTTPISNLGTTPAERLGFDGIAGSDDGFTPEELAQRRSVRDELAIRQKQEFAGINFGAGFFGWLAATGLAVILYTIGGGIAVASGLAQPSVITGSDDTVKSLGSAFDTHTLQITALVVLLVVLFVSYFVGGFVASRMARFSGLKQGLAVWLWGLVMSIIVAVVVVVIASQSSSAVSSFQDSVGKVDLSTVTSTTSLITEGLVVVLSIGGALLGGLAGQSFHRRVDRFGIEDV